MGVWLPLYVEEWLKPTTWTGRSIVFFQPIHLLQLTSGRVTHPGMDPPRWRRAVVADAWRANHSFVHSFIHPCIQSFVHSSLHSFDSQEREEKGAEPLLKQAISGICREQGEAICLRVHPSQSSPHKTEETDGAMMKGKIP